MIALLRASTAKQRTAIAVRLTFSAICNCKRTFNKNSMDEGQTQISAHGANCVYCRHPHPLCFHHYFCFIQNILLKHYANLGIIGQRMKDDVGRGQC